jgi:rare lipoprotein A
LADRYSGRHIRQARQARHAAWLGKKRSHLRPNRQQLLPAAAALTVAGVLIGGSGAVLKLHPPRQFTPDASAATDPANFPPADRDAVGDRASRRDVRTASESVDATLAQQVGAGKVISTGTCDASYYDEGQTTANGERFDPNALTAAHRSLPFNTQVRVTNVANGESVVVRINDRGPFVPGRCLGLSRASFAEIANLGTGVIDVRYEVLVQDAT